MTSYEKYLKSFYGALGIIYDQIDKAGAGANNRFTPESGNVVEVDNGYGPERLVIINPGDGWSECESLTTGERRFIGHGLMKLIAPSYSQLNRNTNGKVVNILAYREGR